MLLPELRTKLNALGISGVSSQIIFLGRQPATPDSCITLFETAGAGPQYEFGGSTPAWERPSLQVLVRGDVNDYETPRQMIESIYQAFGNLGAFTQSGVRYQSIAPLQAPFQLTVDSSNRRNFVCNFLIEKGVSSS